MKSETHPCFGKLYIGGLMQDGVGAGKPVKAPKEQVARKTRSDSSWLQKPFTNARSWNERLEINAFFLGALFFNFNTTGGMRDLAAKN